MDGNLLSLTDFLLAKGVACETNVIYGVPHVKGWNLPRRGTGAKSIYNHATEYCKLCD